VLGAACVDGHAAGHAADVRMLRVHAAVDDGDADAASTWHGNQHARSTPHAPATSMKRSARRRSRSNTARYCDEAIAAGGTNTVNAIRL
jgi:hypothetical protein